MPKFAMASGHLIDIDNFTAEDVILDDIAHHLSKLQRFNGATPIDVSYTVAEHCISLSQWFGNMSTAFEPYAQALAKLALLHDASEAYLSDLVSPVKYKLNDYLELEKHVESVIYKRFNLETPKFLMSKLKFADKRILIDEVMAVIPSRTTMYMDETNLFNLGCKIEFNNHPSASKWCFLNLAKKLEIV